ncbi:MAG: 1,6-anhydro-N-acetylmuramyl-L-alanine amidase AmpD [Pseudomonadota bacterium]|nr:1,6-anhydro-N-acetylmuramyl-L-alanine amidase AmpD [Pseudomonadota bacterium]
MTKMTRNTGKGSVAARTLRGNAAKSDSAAIDSAGWLHRARRVISPNCDLRPDADDISLLVIHGISLPPGRFGGPWIDALFTNTLDPTAHPYFASIAELRVSAHVCIRRTGVATQYVSFAERAWHAGVSTFDGRSRCNDFSIGIELEGTDEKAYTARQYARLAGITAQLLARYPKISGQRVVGHSDIAPGRKTDPGPHFDWKAFRRAVQAARR